MHFKRLAAVAATIALAATATACGGEDESTASTTSTAPQEQSKPAPVAEIPALSGKDTAVTLDAGFVEALGTLKLTPAPVGTAEITEAGVAEFPITGGNVTYYEPGTVSPYVQGMIDHDGSGLSLTGGGKTVELTDFQVDPGKKIGLECAVRDLLLHKPNGIADFAHGGLVRKGNSRRRRQYRRILQYRGRLSAE